MKPRVAIGVSYFQSVHELPRLLDPIYKHVDLIIAIDGRYPLFDYNTNVSTDGSTELLLQKYNAVVEINKDPVEQIDKRNQYLEIADHANMDFLLVCDTDDYLHTEHQDWKLFYSNLAKLPDDQDLANMWFWMNPLWRKNWNLVKDNSWQLYTRIIRPSKVRYDTAHWWHVEKDDRMSIVVAEQTIEGLRFNSDSTLRTEDYIQRGFKWAEKQLIEENERMKRAGRKRFNFWKKQMEKAMATAIPGTIVKS